MPTYFAVTLGPIYQTLIRQRKTRSVFAASYLFSYTMRKLMEYLTEADAALSAQILTPSPDFLDEEDYQTPGCGLYSDRLLMLARVGQEEEDWQHLANAREKTLDHLVNEFQRGKKIPGAPMDRSYLDAYLKIFAVKDQVEAGEETVNALNRHLDHLELFENYPVGADDDHLLTFFNQVKGHFLLEDAFGQDKNRRFDTLTEIATRGLSRYPDDKLREQYHQMVHRIIVRGLVEEAKGSQDTSTSDLEANLAQDTNATESNQAQGGKRKLSTDDAFYTSLFQLFPEDLMPYHRYIAVVNVDGDNFGKHIANLGGDSAKLKDFSNRLLRFGRDAKIAIETYGGSPVYIGGDDLLFFAPVASRFEGEKQDTQTIFDLVQTLDQCFHGYFPGTKSEDGRYSPTLSYGISLSYYKYPLNEALRESYQLLDRVKNKGRHPQRHRYPQKNAIAFRVLKHSGQYFDAAIAKDHPADLQAIGGQNNSLTLYQHFCQLLQRRQQGEAFINSITYSLNHFQDLLGTLLIEDSQDQRVQHLFDNHMNEAIHERNRPFIDEVVAFTQMVFQSVREVRAKHLGAFENTEEATQEALSLVYSTLRFIDFVRSATPKSDPQHA